MKLRNWQSECIDSALSLYRESNSFLVLGTPGAGKTVMASSLGKTLYDKGEIDLVLCFSPSSIVAQDFSAALSEQFSAHFDGTLGAMGNSYTYQGLSTLSDNIWRLFDRYRVFAIFDEIHHCAGSHSQDANAWGATIIQKIKNKATYTIALTGTPWRSDSLPIVLADYCNESGQIQCDYIYGLKEAIRDKVCRVPQVVALDNDNITVVEGSESSYFNSFSELFSQSIISYSEIVTSDLVIEQLLKRSNDKLDELRLINSNAGGLIVASSILHARQIQLILKQTLSESALVVTSNEDDPNGMIKHYRYSDSKWIISVGMISEGTNIPRLQVCCYLSNVKTEMYYRQVLGRILRFTDAVNQEAYFFMPAEPNLIEYAYRVAQDIPSSLPTIKFSQMTEELTVQEDYQGTELSAIDDTPLFDTIKVRDDKTDNGTKSIATPLDTDNTAAPIQNERVMGLLGRFKQETLAIDGFGHLSISKQSLDKLTHYGVTAF